MQHRFLAHALDEGQRLAVGRRLWTNRTTGRGHDGLDLTVLPIQALDRVDHVVRVLVVLEERAGADIFGKVDKATVRADGRFTQVLLVVLLLGQLQSAATAHVIHPQLARAERAFAGEMLATDEVLAIRRPRRIIEQAEVFLADLECIAATCRHAPQVVAAAAIRGEGDFAAVRREARLHIPGRTRADAFGIAACDGQQVEIAEQIENDLLAIRTHVEVHPGAFVHAEANRLGGTVIGIDIPLGFLLLGILGFRIRKQG